MTSLRLLAAATLGDQFQEYLVHAQTYRGLADHTISAYSRDGRKFLRWATAAGLPDDPNQITREHVQRFANSLAGLAPATVRRSAYVLSAFFSHLQREGRIAANPATRLLLPRRRRRLPKVPTIEQAERLMAAACDERERAIVSLLLMAGLRRSELVGLDREDVSEDCAELRIDGKGGAERLVPLPADAQLALARHIEKASITEGSVFRGRTGRRLQQTSLQRIWKRIVERA